MLRSPSLTSDLPNKEFDPETSILARDASKFYDYFEDAINLCAPHIYISALPFAPSESRISTTYGPKFKKTLTVLEGRRVNWDPHRYTKYVREGKLSLVGHDLSTRPTEGRKGAYFLTCGRYSIAASSLADARELIQVPSVMPVLVARILAMRKDYSWFVVIREDKSVGICRWDWALRDRIRMAYEPIIASDTSAATFVGNERLVLGSSKGMLTVFGLVSQEQEGKIAININWITARGREVGQGLESIMLLPRRHCDTIHSLASSPDGLRFVSGSEDNSLII